MKVTAVGIVEENRQKYSLTIAVYTINNRFKEFELLGRVSRKKLYISLNTAQIQFAKRAFELESSGLFVCAVVGRVKEHLVFSRDGRRIGEEYHP